MKLLPQCLLIGSSILTLSHSAVAVPLNSGFETGDLSNWNASIPSDYSEFDVNPRPAGNVGVVSSWQRGFMPGAKTAEEGNHFLAIGSQDSAFYTNTLTYDITVSQTFTLQQGQSLTGAVSFYNGDMSLQDSAWVKIFDAVTFDLVALPWQDVSGAASPVAYREASDWTSWQWAAPVTGEYTLMFGVTTQGDNRFGSYGFFDAVGVMTATVPEPSALALALAGFAGLAWRRKAGV